ncbi:hypothetical protein L484_009792 [Morus notabilis]|uniref:Uncharacterized protein n=1 Tax=Morus notabilis TaxID=981085 RepID=W9SXM7_9ROSA|nr:hypothetical protein L484_009792 [Morus notabilis]
MTTFPIIVILKIKRLHCAFLVIYRRPRCTRFWERKISNQVLVGGWNLRTRFSLAAGTCGGGDGRHRLSRLPSIWSSTSEGNRYGLSCLLTRTRTTVLRDSQPRAQVTALRSCDSERRRPNALALVSRQRSGGRQAWSPPEEGAVAIERRGGGCLVFISLGALRNL